SCSSSRDWVAFDLADQMAGKRSHITQCHHHVARQFPLNVEVEVLGVRNREIPTNDIQAERFEESEVNLLPGRRKDKWKFVLFRLTCSYINVRIGKARASAEIASTVGRKTERRCFQILQCSLFFEAVEVNAIATPDRRLVIHRVCEAEARTEVAIFCSHATGFVAGWIARINDACRSVRKDL